MTINTAAEATFGIGTTAAVDTDQNEATVVGEFQTDTYDDVGEVEDIGEFGDSFSVVTFNSLSDARVQKLKGSADGGEITLAVGYDSNDSAQSSLRSALADSGVDDYNFRVILNDAITTGSGAGGTEIYFRGKVTAFRVAPGGGDNVVRANVTIALNSGVFIQSAT